MYILITMTFLLFDKDVDDNITMVDVKCEPAEHASLSYDSACVHH